jgi:UDP-3-O-[3-hydroxymyristoyl] glucosamine N-acyltransferase
VTLRLGSIVDSLGGVLHGDPQTLVHAIASLEAATPQDLSFLSHVKYRHLLAASEAACVVVGPDMLSAALERGACIVTDQPYLYFAKVTQFWKSHHTAATAAVETGKPQIHASSVVDSTAQVHPSAVIGPLCVVEAGAQIGAFTVLKSRVTVGENCTIGERCVLHSGVVIGADGFGFAPHAGGWEKIEQLGAVCIGNDVEIGANSCVDRGALQNTVIEDGVKLDNLIQIGHNVRIGKHTAMAGCVGVAGSATIGAHCTVGGGAVILGHLQIADHVNISAATVVTKSITKPGHYTGIFPFDDNTSWEKNAVTLKQLHSLRQRVIALENTIKKTEQP